MGYINTVVLKFRIRTKIHQLVHHVRRQPEDQVKPLWASLQLSVRGLEAELQGVLRELGLREFDREMHAFPHRRVEAPVMM